jgi:endonuclease/exonuclease/phosphatase family metal-dependent hydrolase
MNWLYALGFACLLALAVPADAETLRVMTFNVRYPAKGDGPDLWEKRRDLLVETIREKDPDIMGTQELFFEQGEHIVKMAPEYNWIGLSRRGNHEDEHMGVFYKRSRLRLLESGDFWLSETPEKPGSMDWEVTLPRIVTWALFHSVDTARKFYFYNTHFAHRREDGEARINSAKLIRSRIQQLPADIPVIMTGDFNAAAGSEPHKILTQDMKDAWEVTANREGPEGTFHGFKGTPREARIDWILFRGPIQAQSVETVTTNRDGRYPSDHFPVFAVLELN